MVGLLTRLFFPPSFVQSKCIGTPSFSNFLKLWQVNLVEWLKTMVGNRKTEEVVDPDLETKPSTRALKRALLVALRCVDPDSVKRPKMSQVVRMLEADDFPYREVLIILPPIVNVLYFIRFLPSATLYLTWGSHLIIAK